MLPQETATANPLANANPRPGPRGWGAVVIVVVATGLATALATRFDEFMAREIPALFPDHHLPHHLIKLARYPLDDPELIGIFALLALLSTRSPSNDMTQPQRGFSVPLRWRIPISAAFTMLSVAALTHLLKFLIGRARPEAGLGPWALNYFGNPFDLNDSFPSGHSSGAWAGAILIGLYVPWARWILYPVAALTCLSRIMQGRHWFSDTVAGTGLAVVCVIICGMLFGTRVFTPLRFGHTKAD